MKAEALVKALLEDDLDLVSAMREQPSSLPRIIVRNTESGTEEPWWDATQHLDQLDGPTLHRTVAHVLADAGVDRAVGRLDGTATRYTVSDDPGTVYELVDFTARDVRDVFDYLWSGGYLF